MKRIACFCIPAHGHTNPMLPVVKELIDRGNKVRFYSFKEFEEKIRATGAEFIECDRFLAPIDERQLKKLKKVSTTEMTIQDIRATVRIDPYMKKEIEDFRPDVIYTDSVCFWGKLTAMKYGIPMVVSTSTFAFNRESSKYMKNSLREIVDLIVGIPKIGKELKVLEGYGYHVKNAMELVQSDNETDTVVYTSARFQPCSESFSEHYRFIGSSVFSQLKPQKNDEMPLIYISMGTVINERPAFYRKCMDALKDMPVEVVISVGRTTDVNAMGNIPGNVTVVPYVDQLEVLSRASVFITHCGMNSVSESLYMATPMVLYPMTGEQQAVARRVGEMGAGIRLEKESVEAIRTAVNSILKTRAYAEAAQVCSEDLRNCAGPAGAAEFIEKCAK